MATIVNNPAPATDGGNSMGFLLGVILLIVFGVLFFIYGLPYLRGAVQTPQINVPSKVDVNVHNQ